MLYTIILFSALVITVWICVNKHNNIAIKYYNRGCAKYDLGQYSEAIEYFDKAISIDKDYKEAYNNRGAAKDDLGQYMEAIEDYDKVIGIDKECKDAYYNRGNAKYNIGQYLEAIEDYDKAISLDPENQQALEFREQLLQEMNNRNS